MSVVEAGVGAAPATRASCAWLEIPPPSSTPIIIARQPPPAKYCLAAQDASRRTMGLQGKRRNSRSRRQSSSRLCNVAFFVVCVVCVLLSAAEDAVPSAVPSADDGTVQQHINHQQQVVSQEQQQQEFSEGSSSTVTDTLLKEAHATRDERRDYFEASKEPQQAEQHLQQHPQQQIEDEGSATHQPAESSSDETAEDDDTTTSFLPRDSHGIVTLDTYESFAPSLDQDGRPHGLLLALLYTASESCPQQDPWVSKLQDAAQFVRSFLSTATTANASSEEDIQFGKLETSQWDGANEWLINVGVETTPFLVFVVARNFDENSKQKGDDDDDANTSEEGHVFLLDYIGPLETAEDVANTVLQYYYRLFQTTTTPSSHATTTRRTNIQPFAHLPHDFGAHIVPVSFANMASLQAFWNDRQPVWQQIANSIQDKPGGISPKWGDEDLSYIQWLLTGAGGAEQRQQHSKDARRITLLVQCQSSSLSSEPTTTTNDDDTINGLYVVFAEMAWILSSRRDVWFLALHDECPPEILQKGQVAAFQFAQSGPWSKEDLTWEAVHSVSPLPQQQQLDDSSKNQMRRFLMQQSTPAVIWFDRWATAPITFADAYQVHFLLLVNFLPLKDELDRYDDSIQQIVQDFHVTCVKMKQDLVDDVICLIVPSTETRMLTSFDVDLWTPLDQRATTATTSPATSGDDTQQQQTSLPLKFPTLLITDRRPEEHRYRNGITTITHGVRRYYLRPPDIFQHRGVSQFVHDFWNHQLVPDLRSSTANKDDDKVNAYGVTSLTGLEFQQRFQTAATSTEHALVLFTSPTCGHCKRFHNVWNEVSQLLRELKWDQHLALYKIDVSQNEVHKMSLPWLPDVYYFPPILTEDEAALPVAPIRYDTIDDFRNGVGRVSEGLEIVDWWLDVMIGEGDWMDPDLLLAILDDKEETGT